MNNRVAQELDICVHSVCHDIEKSVFSIGRFQSAFVFVCSLNAYTSSRTKLSCAQKHQETNPTTRIRLRKGSVSECSSRTRFFIDLTSRFKSSASPSQSDGVPSFSTTKNVLSQASFFLNSCFSSPPQLSCSL